MQEVLLSSPSFQWVDIVAPSANELREVADKFSLRKEFIEDSLNPKHLPKFERDGETLFVIIRHFDLEAKRRAESTEKLTRKIAMVVTPNLLLTIHRKSQPFFQSVATRFGPSLRDARPSEIALDLIKEAMQTYESQIENDEKDLEVLEDSIFEKSAQLGQLTQIHRIIRRLSVFKRILIHSGTIFQRWSQSYLKEENPLRELKELNDHSIFFCDELLEDGRSLLQLHLSLASHRTGEIMRVLTLFSSR